MPLYVPLSSSELLHTRGSKADKADEEGKSFYKMTIFLFLWKQQTNYFALLDFFMMVWRNAFTGRWKLPRSSFNRSYNLSLFNQLQNGCQPAWIICTAKKTFLWKACLCLCEVFADIIFLWKVRLQVYILFWWKEFEVSNVMQTLSLF